MALQVLLLSTVLYATVQAQSRFPPYATCLERGLADPTSPVITPSCIRCSSQVTVDAGRGADCSREDGSLSGRTCSQLEDVLESLAVGATRSGDCVQVDVVGGEAYRVLARESRVIRQSVVIRGPDEEVDIASWL